MGKKTSVFTPTGSSPVASRPLANRYEQVPSSRREAVVLPEPVKPVAVAVHDHWSASRWEEFDARTFAMHVVERRDARRPIEIVCSTEAEVGLDYALYRVDAASRARIADELIRRGLEPVAHRVMEDVGGRPITVVGLRPERAAIVLAHPLGNGAKVLYFSLVGR